MSLTSYRAAPPRAGGLVGGDGEGVGFEALASVSRPWTDPVKRKSPEVEFGALEGLVS